MLLLMTGLTGIAYPLFITLVANTVFPDQARGSVLRNGDRIVGSALIGQSFIGPGYFWSRPSATGPVPYNAAASSGSNLGPSNPALRMAVQERVDHLRTTGGSRKTPLPVDLVTASGSGLDPHISPAAAEYQIARVAKQRGLTEQQVRQLVIQYKEGRQLGLLGDPRVNVVKLNLALDRQVTGEGKTKNMDNHTAN